MSVLFTSDLDRTLIFSERTKRQDADYICIEQLDGRKISYMSSATFAQLTMLLPFVDFVPATTRSVKQYERLTVFQQALQPKLAIVANGGIILRNGRVDEVWQQHITDQMTKLPLLREQVLQQFSMLLSAPFVIRVHEVDDLFFVAIIDVQQFDRTQLAKIQLELECYEWTCHLQGKKLYIIPRFLTKGAAVQYVKAQGRYTGHVAAGDSVMDLPMLMLADTCFIPQHGELANASCPHGLPIMAHESSDFSDAFLHQLVTSLKNTGAVKF